MEEIVFIILRCITNNRNNDYWKYSFECIEKFHPGIKIYIIDDHSKVYDDEAFSNKYNIIKSEFLPGRGEILAYYYLHKLKLAKKAIIIHDSVFINTKIRFEDVNNFRLFWNFNSRAKYQLFHLRIKQSLIKMNINYDDLEQFNWKGCFGLMGIFEYDFIDKIQKKTNLFNVLINDAEKILKTDHNSRRLERIAIERIMGYLFYKFNENKNCNPYFGDIFKWIMLVTGQNKSEITYIDWHNYKEQYINIFTIMKIFTGR